MAELSIVWSRLPPFDGTAREHHLGDVVAEIPSMQIDAKIEPMRGFRQGATSAIGELRVNVAARSRENRETAIMKLG